MVKMFGGDIEMDPLFFMMEIVMKIFKMRALDYIIFKIHHSKTSLNLLKRSGLQPLKII